MGSITTFSLPSQIGRLLIALEQQKVISLVIDEDQTKTSQINISMTDADIKVKELLTLQLEHYFTSAMFFKKIPLTANGTEFQMLVWRELVKIPIGETRTYGDIAKILNSSARAVGNACRNNPIQIIIPCHRVVSAKGMGGYAGEVDGEKLNIKRWLLRHEGVVI